VTALAEGQYIMRDHAGAIKTLSRLLNIPASSYLTIGAAYGQQGKLDEAKVMAGRAIAMSPSQFDSTQIARMTAQMCAERSDAEHWLEGFRKAGIAV
jgi:adenylate cyclase